MIAFRIADSFTDSLTRLTGEEQKAVKTTAFDLQMNPAGPGLRFHRIDASKDKHFWSVRVSRDIRLIVHKTDGSLLLCYVDHHDDAYAWAERRRIERHPRTGAAQLVEVRETVREIEVPRYVDVDKPPAPRSRREPLFEQFSDDALLDYGVPTDWLDEVRGADEDRILEIAEHLPREAAEALLELATGGAPARPAQTGTGEDPFAHPDAQRRFRVMDSSEELEQALTYPWEKWIVFLHPHQRSIVERRYSGPARVAGSAGTGKTIVAIHRAAHLAQTNPGATILLTTFSRTLASHLRQRLRRLASADESVLERIQVRAMDEVGIDLYERLFGRPTVPTPAMIRALLAEATRETGGSSFSSRFIETEWTDVVDAWQIRSWDAYRDVARLGRRKRLGEAQRRDMWAIFEAMRKLLEDAGLITMSGVFGVVTEDLGALPHRPFDFAVIDEAQDVGVAQLRCLAALAGEREDGLFFAGDLGQRIFQTPFSWLTLGVDVRGRSHTLRINYRTSHQIREQADRLLPPQLADVDGVTESRRGTVSAFSGPRPEIRIAASEEEETGLIAAWLKERVKEGITPHEMAVFVRSDHELPRAVGAVKAAGLSSVTLDAHTEPMPDRIAVSPMHLAKGLEFRCVVVAACDDEVIPLQSRIELVADEGDLEDVYTTERHLLYVACTRARDHLLVTGMDPASEFLDDLGSTPGK